MLYHQFYLFFRGSYGKHHGKQYSKKFNSVTGNIITADIDRKISDVYIPGRELDLPIVENAELIASKIKKILQVNEDDDTTVNIINDGQQLLVQLPEERLKVAADYSVSTLQTGAESCLMNTNFRETIRLS